MAWNIDREKAKAAGYTDEEIDRWLSEKNQVVVAPTITPIETPTSTPPPKISIDREKAKAVGYTDQEIDKFLNEKNNPQTTDIPQFGGIKTPFPITQEFGEQSQYEPQSGGINYGRDYGTPPGTNINLPKGKYRIVSAYKNADPQGGNLNNWENQGYGNSILVRNEDTGEYIRLSHLSEVPVNEGDIVTGENIAKTGSSGHVTGSHLDAEYYDKEGNIKSIADTPYKDLVMENKKIDILKNLETPISQPEAQLKEATASANIQSMLKKKKPLFNLSFSNGQMPFNSLI